MRLLPFLFFLTLTSFIQAQSYSTGCVAEDPEVYQGLPKVPYQTGVKFDELPYKVDLTKDIDFPVRAQGKQPLCVSLAITNALALMEVQDQPNRVITNNSLPSAWELHKNTNRQLQRGVENSIPISAALENLKNNGTSSRDISNHQIKQYYRLFESNANPRFKVHQIRTSLAAKTPVVFSLPIDSDFEQLNSDNAVYKRQPNASSKGLHAMTIVGYNLGKKAFKVLNSWGAAWGDKGYCWIPFKEIKENCNHAYQLQLKNDNAPVTAPTSAGIPNNHPVIELSGVFKIKIPTGEEKVIDAAKGITQPFFTELPIIRKGAYYESSVPIEMDDAFLITIENVQNYLYAFSFDPNRDLEQHFPYNLEEVCPGTIQPDPTRLGNEKKPIDKTNSSYILNFNNEIAIPPYDETLLEFLDDGSPIVTTPSMLGKTIEGIDYLCIINSKEEIPENVFLDLLCNLETEADTTNFLEVFSEVFKKYLIPQQDIQYDPQTLSFVTKSNQGVAVPIIIKVEAYE